MCGLRNQDIGAFRTVCDLRNQDIGAVRTVCGLRNQDIGAVRTVVVCGLRNQDIDAVRTLLRHELQQLHRIVLKVITSIQHLKIIHPLWGT